MAVFCFDVTAATELENPELPLEWLKLGHYQLDTRSAANVSEIDGGNFFLSPNGKSDPHAELQASVAQYLTQPEQFACRFPARSLWLQQYLNRYDLPGPEQCPELINWLKKIGSDRLSLVFPSAYFGNPSSIFGHTFLKFSAEDRTPLTDYTVNFAVEQTDISGAIEYMRKGLTGGYIGSITVKPYHLRLQEYQFKESREIFEYPLALSKSQITTILYHLWELRQAEIAYYFLDENCSYQILRFLEVATPHNLSGDFSAWTLPSDTINTLADKGLIEASNYRPAALSDLETQINQLPRVQQSTMKAALKALSSEQIQAEDLASFSPDELAIIHRYLYYLTLQDSLDRGYAGKMQHALINQRSKPINSSSLPPVTPDSEQVVSARAGSRFRIGAFESADHSDLVLGYQPVFQSFSDPASGLDFHSEIALLSIDARVNDSELELTNLTLIRMTSLNPVPHLLDNYSWSVNVNRQRYVESETDYLLNNIEAGIGLTKPLGSSLLYGMWLNRVELGSRLSDDYRLSSGLKAGMRSYAGDWSLDVYYERLESWAGDEHSTRAFSVNQTYRLKRNHALNLNWQAFERFDSLHHSTTLSYQYYFQ